MLFWNWLWLLGIRKVAWFKSPPQRKQKTTKYKRIAHLFKKNLERCIFSLFLRSLQSHNDKRALHSLLWRRCFLPVCNGKVDIERRIFQVLHMKEYHFPVVKTILTKKICQPIGSGCLCKSCCASFLLWSREKIQTMDSLDINISRNFEQGE